MYIKQIKQVTMMLLNFYSPWSGLYAIFCAYVLRAMCDLGTRLQLPYMYVLRRCAYYNTQPNTVSAKTKSNCINCVYGTSTKKKRRNQQRYLWTKKTNWKKSVPGFSRFAHARIVSSWNKRNHFVAVVVWCDCNSSNIGS